MLRDVINAIDLVSHTLSFSSCILIFLGGGYIALHSRVIPKWAATSLWYIGLAAFLNAITILVDWTLGQLHPLSHFQIGTVTETLLIITIAATVGMLFFNTAWRDYIGSRNRRRGVLEAPSGAKKQVRKRSTTPTRKPVVKKPAEKPLQI